MKFEIDFNYPVKYKLYETLHQLGAKIEYFGEQDEYSAYYIMISTLDDLKTLSEKLEEVGLGKYSIVIDFDPHVIYLDDKV